MAGLVFPAMAVCVTLEVVMVGVAAVLRVILKFCDPAFSAAFAGKAAFASLERIFTVSFVLIGFQFASTALTVTLNTAPAVWVEGAPVLPETVPGTADSPGTSNCNFAKA